MAFMGKENKSSMFLANIELSEIIEIIKNICIGKAMGNDKIPPKIIKWAPELFAPILLVIFNKCIDIGYYPNALKVGKVAPLFKKGEKNEKKVVYMGRSEVGVVKLVFVKNMGLCVSCVQYFCLPNF